MSPPSWRGTSSPTTRRPLWSIGWRRDFTATGGDLNSLSRTLVESDEAWAGRGKFKTPQLFLYSAMRALDLRPRPPLALRALRTLGHVPWSPPSPAGYDDRSATWLAPDAMTNRVDAAELLAGAAETKLAPPELVDAILADTASADTRRAIVRAESRQQALTLLLMSPEFQRT